jgi:hypothetical protein
MNADRADLLGLLTLLLKLRSLKTRALYYQKCKIAVPLVDP